jgi:hypothetical protein
MSVGDITDGKCTGALKNVYECRDSGPCMGVHPTNRRSRRAVS